METSNQGKKKFCGSVGGLIVDCGRGECHRLEDQCRQTLLDIVEKHRPILESLRDHIERKSDRTGISVRDLAIRDCGDMVGLLVGLVNTPKVSSIHHV